MSTSLRLIGRCGDLSIPLEPTRFLALTIAFLVTPR
jgi:hypothetical protein